MSERYEKALRQLYDRINFERRPASKTGRFKFRLDRMRGLLTALGEPQRPLPIVHVAGTKGKGSTAALIAGMLQRAGHSVGLYSSPHLESLAERFRVDGGGCPPEELADLIDAVHAAEASLRLDATEQATFFEMTTAIALEHFARRRCEWVVLEVGLGGRLDSTNVVSPRLSVITSVGLDHQAILGHSVEEIAAEKAGIIKPGIPVVSGVREANAAAVIRRIADEQGAPLEVIGKDFDFTPLGPSEERWTTRFSYRSADSGERADLQLAMPGTHQCHNAAVAVRAIEKLQQSGAVAADDNWIRSGLRDVRLPARCEYFPGAPGVLLDAAHNDDSVRALIDTLAMHLPDRKPVFVFATSLDKDAETMLAQISRAAAHIVLTQYESNPRQRSPEELRGMVASEAVEVVRPVAAAIDRARSLASREGTVVVCGSFFLAAEARPLLVAGYPCDIRPTLVSK